MDAIDLLNERLKPFPRKVMVVTMSPQSHDFFYDLWKSQMMQDLAEKDNNEVGDFSGMKSSIKEKAETISDAYMH